MSNYWQERMVKSQDALTTKTIKETEKQLIKYYSNAMKKVIDSFEITYAKILLQAEQGKDITPALLFKLDSYWQMQGELKKELQKLGEKQIVLLSKQFEQEFKGVYESIAIPSQKAYSTISKENITQLVNQIWAADGKSWSQRVWDNTERLAQTLNDELVHCVVTGKKTSQLKRILQERFNVSYHRADSLARTELAHIQTQAAQKRYEDYGIKEVQVWADKDERRCEVCGKLHKKRYPIYAQMPIPAHPNCRCCIIPVVED